MARLDFDFPKVSDMRELSFKERGELQRDLDLLLNSIVPWQKHTLFFTHKLNKLSGNKTIMVLLVF